MSKIIIKMGDCSMQDVYRLMAVIKRNKFVIGVHHEQEFSGLTPVAADWAYCPHCKEALIAENYCLHCERDVTPNR
jgi:hypothetical protein